jgi:hypothetical protein
LSSTGDSNLSESCHSPFAVEWDVLAIILLCCYCHVVVALSLEHELVYELLVH